MGVVSLIIKLFMLLRLVKERYFEVGTKFGSLLMLATETIHHWDYTNIQHITQDWFVQLALSAARGDQSPRLIFHSRQPEEAHVEFLSHSPGRKLRQNRPFHFLF